MFVLLWAVSCGGGDSGAGAPSSPTAPVTAASGGGQTGRVVFHGTGGDSVLDVEVARTNAEKEKGLMNRSSLGADSGMIFAWDSPVRVPFWMKDTLIPLSIAFIAGDGTIVDIQEMEAMTLTPHVPAKSYQYAVEANKGYFTDHGIKPGDRADIDI